MKSEPFFFLFDFENEKPLICPLDEAEKHGILFDVLGTTNAPSGGRKKLATPLQLEKSPLPFVLYEQGFQVVQKNIQLGNTYLLNLTYPTPIKTNYDLEALFFQSRAPYKLLFHNQFVCFSPECFVRMRGNKIYSFPMKGTINAALPQAKESLLASKKELWEHNTIVDLIRNDLAIVAEKITVNKFRYAEKISTHQGEIWQTSSEICGELPIDWQKNPLNLLQKLLPAGSISGAPKEKTCAIIREAEGEKRGYYTGVFGLFDGEHLESAVIIRYIEQTLTGLQFRSGGGITMLSEVKEEYQELLDKVYVPIF